VPDVKQVIVIRKDLNMRKGKMAAQAAHASMKVFLDKLNYNINSNKNLCTATLLMQTINDPLYIWLNTGHKKIVVSVDSLNDLLLIYDQAKKANLNVSIITDSGFTEFHGVPTQTCIAIGPNFDNEIDIITKDLKLL